MSKRIAFFPGHRMLTYEWERGRCLRELAFEPDEEGMERFRAWLQEAPKQPLQLLLDVIEEEFHVEHVPHVIGRDRIDLYKRTAEKRFRSTPYRYVRRLGRLKSGRRDDEILVAGMTNPQLLQPWLDIIDETTAPLRGIYSLPLTGQYLVGALGFVKRPVLLVSQQVESTVRQSYYERGQLRFSRLVPGRYEDVAGFADFVEREIEQTLHYLTSQRIRRRQDTVDVVVVARADDCTTLQTRLGDVDGAVFHLLPYEHIGRKLGSSDVGGSDFADRVFVHSLSRQRLPSNHYGLNTLRRQFFAQRARLALAGMTAAMLLAAAVLAGSAFLQVEANKAGAEEARARATMFERRYESRLQELGEFDYRAVDVKEAVDLLDGIAFIQQVSPETGMAMLGDHLADHPNILIDTVEWRATRDSGFNADRTAASGRATPVLATGSADGMLYHHLRIHGDVVGFGGTYRTAIEYFEAFTESLRARDVVDRLTITQAPFDLEPDTGVSGDSGTGARDQQLRRAEFSLVLRMTGESDEAE